MLKWNSLSTASDAAEKMALAKEATNVEVGEEWLNMANLEGVRLV